jgi:flagellar biosynthesis/type III secretory pathway protein FliH
MAAELEQEIMREIGLGQPYNYFNGSGSCAYIRRQAARSLPNAIQKFHDEGKEVAEPNQQLCNLVAQVDSCEVDLFGKPSTYVLTKTWEVASYVIQAHLYLYHAKTEQDRSKIVRDIREYVQEHYLQRAQDELRSRFFDNFFE